MPGSNASAIWMTKAMPPIVVPASLFSGLSSVSVTPNCCKMSACANRVRCVSSVM